MKNTKQNLPMTTAGILAIFMMISLEPRAETSPFQLSVGAPIQLFDREDDIMGLRLNLLWGRNRKVRGLDVGSFNISDSAIGIGLSAVGNVAKGDRSANSGGLMVSAGANVLKTRFSGIAVAGLFNYTSGDHLGIQLSPFYSSPAVSTSRGPRLSRPAAWATSRMGPSRDSSWGGLSTPRGRSMACS